MSCTQYAPGNHVVIKRDYSGHGYPVGTVVVIKDVGKYNYTIHPASAGEAAAVTAEFKRRGMFWGSSGPLKRYAKDEDFKTSFQAVTIDQENQYLTTSINKMINNSKINTIMQTQFRNATLQVAQQLAKANNTFTTLEVKNVLRKDFPYLYSTQDNVSAQMDEFAGEGLFTYTDNGVYRTYSDAGRPAGQGTATNTTQPQGATVTNTTPKGKKASKKAVVQTTTKAKKIGKNAAYDLMANNKGHFFTVTFIEQDGSERTMNCQYLANQGTPTLGYVKVRESSKLINAKKNGQNSQKAIRNVNLQTIKTLKIGGQNYRIG